MNAILDQLVDELHRTTGLDLPGYRRPTLERRFATRMAKLGIEDPLEYMDRFRSDTAECGRLLDALIVRFSSFFRDPIVFEIIAQSILPEIIERKRAEQRQDLRVWCAGCATGEEAYSIAILIHDALEDEVLRWDSYIFATDLGEEALEVARTGIYPREKFEHIKLGILDRHFIARGSGYEVTLPIRSMVHFSPDNLLSTARVAPAESVFGAFDLVFCRNVLIYLREEWQDRVLQKLHASLTPGGYLVLGSSESLPDGLQPQFMDVDHRNRIYLKRI